ncbi:MAG: ATP-binding protein [Prolixibacteraceae bacterium]|jgi:signal transduction histidine kinase|nr:ATP-binding protein [Prolixibacteraceae bacterium]
MLSFFLIETKTVEMPLTGIIVIGLFSVVVSIYLYAYFHLLIVKKKTIRYREENESLKNEITRLAGEIEAIQEKLDRKIMLISNTFNEIRTPLNAIFGFAELLSDRNLSNRERGNYADMILRNANNLLTIINDISDIAKIEKGLLVLKNEPSNLNYFIDEMARFVKSELKNDAKQHIRVTPVKYLGDNSSCFFIDRQRLRNIMGNLLSNAVKFTNEGCIEFGYKTLEDQFILFYVSDSGIGIEKEYQKNIFDEFTQITGLNSKIRTGSGLGLVVSKNLAELMGGRMWVESVKDSGSTFYFTIPCEPCTREMKAGDELEKFESDCWASHTILIVDDYRDIYYYFSETLVNTGIRFFYADNGQKAIDLCREHPEIELVLMDIQMPGMSGIDATKNIRKFRKDLPIIAQTAYAQSNDFDLFLDAGFNDLITKPIDKDILLNKMGKYLNM